MNLRPESLRPELLPPPLPPYRLAEIGRAIERIAAACNKMTGHCYEPYDSASYHGSRSLAEFTREAACPAHRLLPGARADAAARSVGCEDPRMLRRLRARTARLRQVIQRPLVRQVSAPFRVV
ncbi:hypothetical protein ACIHCQ_18270 [Streptomyces sp. NPDC052236]|uniref:hypothetical protein n=1 Tax=Streptomyces sp. NPDC052236 TaxID=3365686 RepID=UPI0037D7F583